MRTRMTGYRLLPLLLVVFSALVEAQSYPTRPIRPIRLIVPFAPGGSNDAVN
ncbi:MAG: hypothetical protein ACKVQU_33090 [Burkholderiales bacterium]